MKNTARFGFIGLLLFLASCAGKMDVQKPIFQAASFKSLAGWEKDHQAEALPALEKSCPSLSKKDKAWDGVCKKLKSIPQTDAAARAFFEKNFDVYAVQPDEEGLFTGYYEASLKGARLPSGVYQTPLWQRPMNLVTADLGDFKDELKGQKIAGKVVAQKLKPYDDRAAIAGGALPGKPAVAEALVWVEDPINAFFLEIQGSGRVMLPDGQEMRVGYDAQNGHPYTAIGRVLAAEGFLEKPVTMQKIRGWLHKNPAKAQEMMNRNASVIFFREVKGEGPVGAMGVALTPGRSLAVDPSMITLGAPLWLEAVDEKIQKLVVAQDTGGAIKGKVRGDLFWGAGEKAELRAGAMQSKGRYFILWPKGAKVP